MRRTAVSTAIEQQQQQHDHSQGQGHVLELDGLARSAAWWIFVAADQATAQQPAHPPIGSFGPRGRGGNSNPDLSLVAGFSNCLTLDAQREKAGFTHYINRRECMSAALEIPPEIRAALADPVPDDAIALVQARRRPEAGA